jgi:hypothetical protein
MYTYMYIQLVTKVCKTFNGARQTSKLGIILFQSTANYRLL